MDALMARENEKDPPAAGAFGAGDGGGEFHHGGGLDPVEMAGRG
jgi:hypothetical protein